MASDNKEQVAKSTATMSLATLASRITGFLRTWATAFALGNTVLTSAYQIANSMPNMLYELVAGGILSTAFLPVYMARKRELGDEGGNAYASNLLNICLIILGIIALAATVFAPQVIATQTFVTGGKDAELATYFFRFFAIQIIFYGASAIVSGLLNANKLFKWPALGPLFNNVVVIVTMFAFVPLAALNEEVAKVELAVGTSLGVLVTMLVQLPALRGSGFTWRPRISLRDPGLRETARLAVPAVIFTVTNLICVSVRNAFSLGVAETGPSTLSYAWLWYQLPYGVLAVALSTAMFTEMSASAAREDWDAFRDNVHSGLRGTFFLIIPMAVMLIVLSSMLVTLYHAGRFTADDISVVSQVLQWWAVNLPFYAGYMYLYFAFSARRDLMTVTKVNTLASLVQIALYATLTLGFGGWQGFGLIGIPMSDIVFFGIMFAVLATILRRKIGSFGGRGLAAHVARVVIAAIVGGTVAYALNAVMGTTTSILMALAHIIIAGGAGLVVCYGMCQVMRIEEMQLLHRLGNRFFGRFLNRR